MGFREVFARLWLRLHDIVRSGIIFHKLFVDQNEILID